LAQEIRRIKMGEWTLQVGQLSVVFLSTKTGSLGVKFNSSKDSEGLKVYAPVFSKNEIPKFNPKNPQETFHDTRYTDGRNYYRTEDIDRKWFEYDRPEVFITKEKMDQMYPTTKDGKVISKQPLSKLGLKNISAHDGYYLLPKRDYENIQKYKKLIEYLGEDFGLTNPLRLKVGSKSTHNYAVFIDKSQNAVVAVEVLVKSGMQKEPEV
jgi:hypothetical protein